MALPLSSSNRWSRRLLVAGLVLLAIAAIDPLEGSPLLVVAVGLIAAAAFLSADRHRAMLAWAFAVTVVGAAALWTLSALGGIGGDTGRSMWWTLALLPFPVGIVAAVAGAILLLADLRIARQS